MEPIDLLRMNLQLGLGFAATFLVPGVVAGLGTGLVVKLARPCASLRDILFITMSWAIAIVAGAYLFYAGQSLLSFAGVVKPCPCDVGSAVVSIWVPMVPAGSVAAAIGAVVTFRHLSTIDGRGQTKAA